MIRDDGWLQYDIWEHSSIVKDLYTRRCRMEVEEMTCAAQAAALLEPLISPGDSLLDVGCGSGYFYHSLRTRHLPVEYHGIDAAPSLIAIGSRILPEYGLPADRLRVMRIEDLSGEIDHVLCMNVLSNIDNYHRPLERLLKVARKTVILRESISDQAEYRYVHDKYLNDDIHLNVHVNVYPRKELRVFIEGYGFEVEEIIDWRTQGQPELVIDYPHYWTFVVARRNELNEELAREHANI